MRVIDEFFFNNNNNETFIIIQVVSRNLLQRLQTSSSYRNILYTIRGLHISEETSVYMGYIYNWATRNNDRGRACQKRLLTGGSILLRQ